MRLGGQRGEAGAGAGAAAASARRAGVRGEIEEIRDREPPGPHPAGVPASQRPPSLASSPWNLPRAARSLLPPAEPRSPPRRGCPPPPAPRGSPAAAPRRARSAAQPSPPFAGRPAGAPSRQSGRGVPPPGLRPPPRRLLARGPGLRAGIKQSREAAG